MITVSGWGVFWFGGLIGLLTAASSAAGTTVSLIGLMFALVGGSFLAWFRPDTLKDEKQRGELVRLIGMFGKGGVCGLLIGFGFQFVREFWITPAIYKKYKESNLAPEDGGGPGTAPQVKIPEIGSVFKTQRHEKDYLELARTLDDDLKENKRLTPDDRQVLLKLMESLPDLLGVFQQMKANKTRDRLSDKAKGALDNVVAPLR